MKVVVSAWNSSYIYIYISWFIEDPKSFNRANISFLKFLIFEKLDSLTVPRNEYFLRIYYFSKETSVWTENFRVLSGSWDLHMEQKLDRKCIIHGLDFKNPINPKFTFSLSFIVLNVFSDYISLHAYMRTCRVFHS